MKKSLDDGYLVGSRGSVGSSFVATMCQITEVNPLPGHYRCPECKYSEFKEPGKLLPVMIYPINFARNAAILSLRMDKIFLCNLYGFEGDKEPDIDLNFR